MHAKVLGVLAGKDMPLALLRRWAESADVLIAADSGADLLFSAGTPPDVVVGDLDSLTKRAELQALIDRGAARMVADPDQETTDCDKLLALAHRAGYAEITLAAIEGDRMDHMLATLQSAARSPLRVRIALRTGVGWVLGDGDEQTTASAVGRQVSVLPLTPSEGVSLRGVEWPLERSEMAPLGRTSISNRATSNEVSARVLEGSVFFYVELPEDEAPLW